MQSTIERIREAEEFLKPLAQSLKCSMLEAPQKLKDLIADIARIEKENEELRARLS